MASVRNTIAQGETKGRSAPHSTKSPRVPYETDLTALLVVDLSGRIRYLNQAAREMFSLSLEQARGSAWMDCVTVVDRATRMPIHDRVELSVISNTPSRMGFNAVLVSPLGIDIPVKVHVEPFPEPDDVVTGAVMTFLRQP